MNQIVGQSCVICSQRIRSVVGARFCPVCGCPVHEDCARPDDNPPDPGNCRTCGAQSTDVLQNRGNAETRLVWESRYAPEVRSGEVVRFTSEDRLHRWFKFSWYDDSGVLEVTPEVVRFVGQQTALTMPHVTDVRYVGPIIPWSSVVSLILGNVIVVLMAAGGAFQYFTLGSPALYLFLALVNVFALAVWPMGWVRVDYLDGQRRPGVAFFTAGSALGRWMGGTSRLSKRIRQGCSLNS